MAKRMLVDNWTHGAFVACADAAGMPITTFAHRLVEAYGERMVEELTRPLLVGEDLRERKGVDGAR